MSRDLKDYVGKRVLVRHTDTRNHQTVVIGPTCEIKILAVYEETHPELGVPLLRNWVLKYIPITPLRYTDRDTNTIVGVPMMLAPAEFTVTAVLPDEGV